MHRFLYLIAFLPGLAATGAETNDDWRVYADLWAPTIDYDAGENGRDGDSVMWGQGLQAPLPWGLRADGFFAIGREDYGSPHTDTYLARATASKGWRFAEVGLGWNYWNNAYSGGGSNTESGPILRLGAATDPVTESRIQALLDLVWSPVDVGDAEDYEFLEASLSAGARFGQIDARIGYRLKSYYGSPDDYLYQGAFAQVGLRF